MGILDIGIAIADQVTKSLGFQGTVTLEQYTGQSGYGVETYGSPLPVRCVIDLTRKQRPTGSGKLVTVVATLTILEAVAPNGASVNPPRQEPIDPRDRIVLPNGATGPILSDPAMVLDPSTGRPFMNTVLIGEVSSAP